MKRITLLTILLSTLLSCNNDSVKCDGNLEIKTVKEIYKDELLKMNFAFKMNGIDDLEEFLDGFLENNVKFDLIRTKAIDKVLKSCDCAAQLTFELDPEIKKDLENRTSDNNEFQQAVVSKFLGNDGIDIEYSLQETNDGNFVAETYSINEELGQVVMTYYMLESQYKESKIKKFVSKNNEQEIKLLFIDNNKVEITINSFDHSEIFDLEYKNGLLINNNLPENLKDKYYILDGENLKVYISEEEGYELYKKK